MLVAHSIPGDHLRTVDQSIKDGPYSENVIIPGLHVVLVLPRVRVKLASCEVRTLGVEQLAR